MRVKWLIVALLAAAPIGCVEEAKSSEERKAPAPTEKPASVAPKVPRGEIIPDDTDPIVTAAQLASARVADHEERIDAELTAINEELRTLSAKEPRATDLASERLLPLVQELRKSGNQILEKYPKVKADLAAIVKASANVKIGYTRAKELYLDKADKETGDLKERYRTLADLCETFIRTNAERTATYAAFASDLDKGVRKVERHVEFLADFEQFLKLNPGLPGAKDREEFITALDRFADQIIRFGDTIKQFRNKARDGAVSKKLRGEHERALATLEQGSPTPPMTPPVPPPSRVAAAEVPAAKVASAEPIESSPAPAANSLAAAGPRFVPTTVTRCVPTLMPVTYYTSRGGLFRRTTAVTHYEWRHQFVTETVYTPVGQ